MEKFELKEIVRSEFEPDYIVKTIMLGEAGVGKSSLLLSLTGKPFQVQMESTIGIDFGVKNYELNYRGAINNKCKFPCTLKLLLWDCAGQERFKAIVKSYYRNANIAIIVFDVCDGCSFESVKEWYDTLNDTLKDFNVLEICIVGNKTDLKERSISYEEGKNLADNLGVSYIETSAKNNENVKELLDMSLLGLMDRVMKGEVELSSQHKNSMVISERKVVKKNKCCF